jgi:hypothetical protein
MRNTPFFSERIENLRNNWKKITFFAFLFLIFLLVGYWLPEGFDWKIFFSQGNIPTLWTPWVGVIVKFLTFPLLVAITLTSVVIRTFRYSSSPLPAILACISLPTIWVIHLGNLDGLVLLGLLLLPIGAPLVLLKPQIAIFALLAKKSYMIAGAVWLAISIFIWGLWPLNFLVIAKPGWAAEWVQDITLFPYGILLALPLLWLSRKDEDLLMLAGSFATPHLFPYHFILIMPALGKMKTGWMLAAWLLSWSPLLANWLGETAWHFGNLFALVFWFGIFFSKKQHKFPVFKRSFINSQSPWTKQDITKS